MAHNDDEDEPRDMRKIYVSNDEALKLMQNWTGGQSDPLYAISSTGGWNYAWVFTDAIANIDQDLSRVKKLGRNKFQLGKGTFSKADIDELHTIREALQQALDDPENELVDEARSISGYHARETRSTDRLSPRLHDAYEWIASAGEWEDALSSPEQYASDAAANAAEHGRSDITESDLLAVIEWFSGQRKRNSHAREHTVRAPRTTSGAWTVEPGRHLYFDGEPAFRIASDDNDARKVPRVAVDGAAHLIADLFNKNGVTVDSLYEKHMGNPRRRRTR